MERVVYRILKGPEPKASDFLSNREKGFPPRGPEIEDVSLWHGWSVFDQREEAEMRARRYGLGTHLAVMRVPASWADDGARMRKTLGPHHFTMWGSFAQVRTFIEAVVRIRRK